MNDNREYRNMELRIVPTEEGAEPSFFVEGYAATFQPYTLMTRDGVDYKEVIMPNAFDEADLTDVVFRVDHQGTVYARSSAGTLTVGFDDHGLFDEADLSKTAKARELFEEIKAGNYPKQSFAFIVSEDEYDKKSHTRTIKKISKVFDVSPVSFPANPTTELDIKTRDYFNGVIEAEKAERLESEKREKAKKMLELKIKLMESEK